MNAQQIRDEIERKMAKAESGKDWADICALEAQLVALGETF